MIRAAGSIAFMLFLLGLLLIDRLLPAAPPAPPCPCEHTPAVPETATFIPDYGTPALDCGYSVHPLYVNESNTDD